MNISIIGAGYIGAKRAEVIVRLKEDRIVSIFDIDASKSKILAKRLGLQPLKILRISLKMKQ